MLPPTLESHDGLQIRQRSLPGQRAELASEPGGGLTFREVYTTWEDVVGDQILGSVAGTQSHFNLGKKGNPFYMKRLVRPSYVGWSFLELAVQPLMVAFELMKKQNKKTLKSSGECIWVDAQLLDNYPKGGLLLKSELSI